MTGKNSGTDGVIVIKKYANRRLYNTSTSSYVTLDHLCQMVKDGYDFVVYDAKSNEDITRSVLTQIIVEEEAKGQNLLPINFLRQLICLYGDSLQAVVPDYLDMSMQSFSNNQDKMREALPDNLRENPLYRQFEEMSRHNMDIFGQTMKMFSPLSTDTPPPAAAKAPEPAPSPASEDKSASTEMMKKFMDQLTEMQQRLDELGNKKN